MCAPLRLARQFSECSSGGRALALGARGPRVRASPFRLGEPEESLSAAWVFFHIGVAVSTCGRTGAGGRMSMVSGCSLMAERLEKRTRFDSLKSQPNLGSVC